MSELALQTIAAPDATVSVPGSKSFTNRALICAALAPGDSVLVGRLDSDDTRVMIEALGRLGVETEERGPDLLVRGVGGKFAIPLHPLDCGASGTTMRFLTALATLVPGRVVLDGSVRMRERPIRPLLQDDLHPWNPIGVLTLNQVPDDIQRASTRAQRGSRATKPAASLSSVRVAYSEAALASSRESG